MSDVLHAELPADLSAELINEGFEEFIAFRGLANYTGAVVTVASAGLAAGANAATIIVSRDAISGFVAAIRAWVRRKASGQPHGELTIDISATQGDTKTRLRLEVASENGTPEIDTDALTAFITSLFTDKHGAVGDHLIT
jgi:NAD(P)H-hydrate repair Nnr-like enzyme with NAD(P)H-hydrate dehydratase domain